MTVSGNKLEELKLYEMKVWNDHGCSDLKRQETVKFIEYKEGGVKILSSSFRMKDLEVGKNQHAYLEDLKGNSIMLSVLHDNHIWVTASDERVTFSEHS